MSYNCCFYEKGDEKYELCTTDDNCPQLAGWSLTGTWGVDDCKDCGGDPPPKIYERIPWLVEIGEIYYIHEWFRKNRNVLSENSKISKIEGFDRIKEILDKPRR